jgi:two-component system response regulator (stage 0 sporulation protein F)
MNTPPSTRTPEKSGNGSASTDLERRERILLVDDDAEMRSLLADVLSEDGYEVLQAANGAEALILLHREMVGAILLDKNMPGLSGMDLLPGLRLICPHTPVIIITAFGDEHTSAEAEERGGSGVLFKPFRMDELCAMLQRALAPRETPARTT